MFLNGLRENIRDFKCGVPFFIRQDYILVFSGCIEKLSFQHFIAFYRKDNKSSDTLESKTPQQKSSVLKKMLYCEMKCLHA